MALNCANLQKNQDTANTDDQKAATAALPDEEDCRLAAVISLIYMKK